MARRIVVVGGGAGGMGAAGGIKAVDPGAEVVVYTGFDDVAYSPCGIPYVHGREIDNFEKLFLAEKQAYVDAGIDVHYNAEALRRLDRLLEAARFRRRRPAGRRDAP